VAQWGGAGAWVFVHISILQKTESITDMVICRTVGNMWRR
jgi:hypothetical protein